MKLETSPKVTKSKRSLHWCRSISKKISVQVLLQYQSKSYYIIGQEVYYSIGRFITLSGSYYIIGRFLLHYRAVITVSGVYYIIGWYKASSIIFSISLKVAPAFLTTRIWRLLSGSSKWTLRSKLLPTSSVSPLGFESTVSVIGLLILSLSLRRSCCCSTSRATSCLLYSSRRGIIVSSVDDLSSRRCTMTGSMRQVGQVQIPTISL